MSSSVSLPLTGACGCGAVRLQISEPFTVAAYCHCTRCQRRTGTASAVSARVAPGTFRVVAGEEHLRRWMPGGGMDKVFCGLCGSALFSQDPDDPGIVAVRLGAVDGDPGIRPSARQFVADAASWEPIPDDGLPRFPARMPAAG